jgi:EpsI family protein
VIKFAVAIGFLAVNFYIYHFSASEAVVPERRAFEEFPLELGEWNCAGRGGMEDEIERRLGVSDYLICDFTRREPFGQVSVYVGYHATQVREGGKSSAESSIHPPAHCLPGSGWDVIRSESVSLDAPGLPQSPAQVKRLLIAKGEARALVYYWYQSRGRVIADDWKKILYVGWDRATRGRTDGSLVRFSVPVLREDEDGAEAAFRDLAIRVVSHLPPYVPG